MRGDLVKVLKRLTPRIGSFDGVIIETTGLADPAPVAQTFFVDEDIQPLGRDPLQVGLTWISASFKWRFACGRLVSGGFRSATGVGV